MKSLLPDYTKVSIFRRKKGKIEKYVIKGIHKSELCKSMPFLKTLIIENVRICCIVIETSGKGSIKIVCSSVPYIITLISKCNPKLDCFIREKNVWMYLSFLQNCDFQSYLESVYERSITFYKNVRSEYPAFTAYILNVFYQISQQIFHALKFSFEYVYEYMLKSGRNVNYQHVCDFMTFLIQRTASALEAFKSLLLLMKGVSLSYYKNLRSHSPGRTVTRINNLFKKLYCISKALICDYCIDICKLIRNMCCYLYDHFKPFVKGNLQNWSRAFPILLHHTKTVGDIMLKYVELFCLLVQDNVDIFLYSLNLSKRTLLCIFKEIQPFFGTLRTLLRQIFFYICDIYPYLVPYIHSFSSKFFRTVKCFVTHSMQFLRLVCEELYHFVTHEKLMYYARNFLLSVKLLSRCIASGLRIIVSCTRETFLELSPSVWPAVSEVNSSLSFASSEVVAKSLLGVKRISPSFARGLKLAAPPAVSTVSEIMKTSKNAVITISPSLGEVLIIIRPQLYQASVILLSDGNRAFKEVAYLTYMASAEMNYTAVCIVQNIPAFYKGLRVVVYTSSCAVVEVTSASLDAKSRISSDFRKAIAVVLSSLLSAREEVMSSYSCVMLELNSVLQNIPCRHFVKVLCSDIGEAVSSCAASWSCFVLSASGKICHKLFRHFCRTTARNIYSGILNITEVVRSRCFSENSNETARVLDLLNKILGRASGKILHGSALCYRHLRNAAIILVRIGSHKTWSFVKLSVSSLWDLLCTFCPKFWTAIEVASFGILESLTLHTPTAWNATKKTTFDVWNLFINNMPHMWNTVCATTPYLYHYEREVIISSWNIYVSACRASWMGSQNLSSSVWSFVNDCGPRVWFKCCEDTSKMWQLFCSSVRKSYNAGTDECVICWTVLHDNVVLSWRKVCSSTRYLHSTCYSGCSKLRTAYTSLSKSKKYLNDFGKKVQMNAVLKLKQPLCWSTEWLNFETEHTRTS